MDPLKNHLTKIAAKIKQLSEGYLRLKQENEELRKALENANQIIEIQKNRVQNLESKENLTKLATQIVSGPEQHRELKSEIDAMIREVDKCIRKLKE